MSKRLLNRIDEIKALVDQECADPIDLNDFLDLIPQLFDKLKHGEQGHRDWLEKAIEAHFLQEPMPEYVAK